MREARTCRVGVCCVESQYRHCTSTCKKREIRLAKQQLVRPLNILVCDVSVAILTPTPKINAMRYNTHSTRKVSSSNRTFQQHNSCDVPNHANQLVVLLISRTGHSPATASAGITAVTFARSATAVRTTPTFCNVVVVTILQRFGIDIGIGIGIGMGYPTPNDGRPRISTEAREREKQTTRHRK